MRRPLVAGNWKLNGNRAGNAVLLRALCAGVAGPRQYDVMVCPPFVYLPDSAQALAGSGILLGAQDASGETSGAFTGEVAAAMLRDVGCSSAIVGHSERRTHFGDTDARVVRKFTAVAAAGLAPILCVGETLADRQAGRTEAVVRRQLAAVLEATTAEQFATAIVAYEPVWAIGTGQTATPDQAQEVHALIRSIVASRDARMAAALRILYGGSVKGANAAALFAMPDIDGGLVGGASLDAEDFLRICAAAAGSVR
jgi:triosephosphate isomerase